MQKYLKTYKCDCGNLSLNKDKCSDCKDMDPERSKREDLKFCDDCKEEIKNYGNDAFICIQCRGY